MGISLDKVAETAPELLSFATTANHLIAGRDLTAEVALVLDYSGSMRDLYASGAVQELVNKVVGLASQLDDDGIVDLFLFDDQAEWMAGVGLNNFRGSVAEWTKGRRMGSTNYAAAMDAVISVKGYKPSATSMFGNLRPAEAPAARPTLVLFITDGAPNNQKEAEDRLRFASTMPIFFQFLSIDTEIPFLQKLDDLKGRAVDNADYKNVGNVTALTDEELFEMVLDEYPAWAEGQRRLKQIL